MYKKGSKAEILNSLVFSKEEIKNLPSGVRKDAERFNDYVKIARNIDVWIRGYKDWHFGNRDKKLQDN